ncbi:MULTISPECIES: DUF6463 family protein [Streptomyces]|uniref:DUF6463 family protein n=1 Tax=Streptomyces TaxID=1883 RepID=UPI00073DCFA6|nr:DUF6463 family protein [Streptomyces sp. EAS-AB2608]MYU27700.1 hypothetical protein [Streptomyces sp. SID7810]BCM72083.1 hypothetical protein EASAB2608_07417 [Streptomyces sp. EAS-AB2608]CUW26563.1 hypothetical protein TUE45_01275 [Streptomyces reticuli]
MIKWAGWIITLCGTAHTLGALTVEKAAHHAGTWFSGGLWHEDLADMSPAGSAYWLSLDSFGIPLVLIGLTVLWLDRRGITPPAFIAWTLGVWTVVDAVILPFTPWPLFVLACALLLTGIRRARRVDATPRAGLPRA